MPKRRAALSPEQQHAHGVLMAFGPQGALAVASELLALLALERGGFRPDYAQGTVLLWSPPDEAPQWVTIDFAIDFRRDSWGSATGYRVLLADGTARVAYTCHLKVLPPPARAG